MYKNYSLFYKLNIDTGKETEYVFPEGLFAQEPQFIPRPNSSSEDDGVILVQGVDGVKGKGNSCNLGHLIKIFWKIHKLQTKDKTVVK